MSKLLAFKYTFPWQGKTYKLIWKDVDGFEDLDYKKCTQCYGICFYKNKIVVGRRQRQKTEGPLGANWWNDRRGRNI